MRPFTSAYDRAIAASEGAALELFDAEAAEIGDILDYDDAGEIDDAGWGMIRQTLSDRGLKFVDEGNGYEVRSDEEDE